MLKITKYTEIRLVIKIRNDIFDGKVLSFVDERGHKLKKMEYP